MTDDIYEHIRFDGEASQHLLSIEPELSSRTLVVNGVSKTYAMTGWRIGYAAGPADLIAAMDTLQSQSTSNASSISQAAALAALNGDQSFVPQCVRSLQANGATTHSKRSTRFPASVARRPAAPSICIVNCAA